MINNRTYFKFLLISLVIAQTTAYKVIYAVNCGGEEHIDSNGIKYEKDVLKVGTSSDFGKNLPNIARVSQSDEIIYQTERYHTSTFGYEVPLESDGDYVLVLKFSEVYFNTVNAKVFDIVLNGDHQIVSDLDIFAQVGKGSAHDEYIYFSVSRNRLYYKEEESEIRGGKVRIEFIKGYRDNPKVNGIVLIKGTDVNNIPKLPPLTTEAPEIPDTFEMPIEEEKPVISKPRKTSGPKTQNPYSTMDDQLMISIFVGIVLFIPLLFCLCRL
ncbi:CLUMA_CG014287, isoform A [Clunio marinus]|uniref:CLUMA_CG014287, isoform A n=1 Tax=Clunio marinus TaxID=568069 RepID=A0A1J1ING9_9DIPT|nr:CLUMA_CG014287, isoform A [Clunio marinus]